MKKRAPARGWTPRSERFPHPPPAREPGEPDDRYFLRILPPPPPAGGDDVVCEWMTDVIYAGGPAGLTWAFQAENWPEHLKQWRMRNDHAYHQLMRQAELNAVRERESAARAQRLKVENERKAVRAKAGW